MPTIDGSRNATSRHCSRMSQPPQKDSAWRLDATSWLREREEHVRGGAAARGERPLRCLQRDGVGGEEVVVLLVDDFLARTHHGDRHDDLLLRYLHSVQGR